MNESLLTLAINQNKSLIIKQKFEIAELVGFETRNKYTIENENGDCVGFAAEQHKNLLGYILRQIFGHWRKFQIVIFDSNKNPVFLTEHPFRFVFQRLEIKDTQNNLIGVIQQKFSIVHKYFEVQDSREQILMTVKSPIWKPWTFPFERRNRIVASIFKKWSGIINEAFTDRDQFKIEYQDPTLNTNDKTIILAAGLFIDIMYFEKKS